MTAPARPAASLRLPPALAHLAPAGEAVERALAAGEPLVLVDSPPGAGKSTLLTRLAASFAADGARVLVVTCTNSVGAELACRLLPLAGALPVTFVLGRDAPVPAAAAELAARGQISVTSDLAFAARAGGVVIGNAAKWDSVPDRPGAMFDIAFYDEAYQLPYHRLWPILSLSSAHVLVGDPSQCSPFSEAPTGRWLGQPTSPVAAGAAALAHLHPEAPVIRLIASMRLLQDTVDLVQPALYTRTCRSPARRLGRAGSCGRGPRTAARSGGRWACSRGRPRPRGSFRPAAPPPPTRACARRRPGRRRRSPTGGPGSSAPTARACGCARRTWRSSARGATR
jgi:hypothetical protein